MALGQCPNCGRFCSKITALVGGFGGDEFISSVSGSCKTHGQVDLSKGDWCWEDFFGWD